MTKTKFRRAAEITGSEPKVPIGSRIRSELKTQLQAEADSGEINLSVLVESILEDYGKFLKEQKRRR